MTSVHVREDSNTITLIKKLSTSELPSLPQIIDYQVKSAIIQIRVDELHPFLPWKIQSPQEYNKHLKTNWENLIKALSYLHGIGIYLQYINDSTIMKNLNHQLVISLETILFPQKYSD